MNAILAHLNQYSALLKNISMTEIKNFDAEFCGNLAIHQTNTIQDYGYLLVLDRSTLEIVQGSENLNIIFATPVQEIIGNNISALLDQDDLANFKKEVTKGERTRVPLRCSFMNNGTATPVNLLFHVKEKLVILEIEKDDQQPERIFSEVFQEVRSFIASLEKTDSLQEVCERSIHEIRRISGFDGIRMYRFDEQWNGHVIVEEIEGELESYLGQVFPPSDVPRQARELYKRNPFRLIPNRNYQGYRLFPVINPVTAGFLDLSDCNLRSIAAVHLEYMANMNVTASISIRVMVDGVLWGLISCHHITAKYLSLENRSVFEWLSMEISYRIASIIKQEELALSGMMLTKKAAVVESIYAKGDITAGLLEDQNQNLLSLFNASGFAMSMGGKISSAGLVPGDDELENLMLWANGKGLQEVFAINEFGEVYEDAKRYTAVASGVLVIPVNAAAGEFIICFRNERVKDINWGGNPNQAINFEKDGINYHPRNSFKLWQQTVYGQSENWNKPEIEMAESLRNFMFQFSTSQPYH